MSSMEDGSSLSSRARKPAMGLLVLSALGIVYGDIGTSPLYAFRECFHQTHGVPATPANILGVLSLIFWSLVAVVSVKYASVVMLADNEGEGGVLALMARVLAGRERYPGRHLFGSGVIVLLGLCGSALLVADGMITPSISVLSAVEGLELALPISRAAIMSITIGVLIGLFQMQRYGTGRIGVLFGPVMLLWFACIATLGLVWIFRNPVVLAACNPMRAVEFFSAHRLHGLIVFGAVVLCVTGCEALYADMGHFGRRPIVFAWYLVVFPAVVANYFGQGALLLGSGAAGVKNPFFELAPGWLLYPTVALATAATIIASQALISGMFSLVRQAIHLSYLPRMQVVHTSETMHGQIYIPEINAILGTACVLLVLGFRDSSGMAAAYGIAVIGTMSVTSLLMFFVEQEQWGWSLWRAGAVTGVFLVMDGAFLLGNLAKVVHGGWFPLAIGAGVLAVLTSWKRGSEAIDRLTLKRAIPLIDFLQHLGKDSVPRVKGTAVFLMPHPDHTPRVLLHHIKHNKVLQERTVLMCIVLENVPSVIADRQIDVKDLGEGMYKVTVRLGFMESLDMRSIIELCERQGLILSGEISYYIGHMTLLAKGNLLRPLWRKALFAFMFHNERSPTASLGIRPNRVVELGEQVEI